MRGKDEKEGRRKEEKKRRKGIKTMGIKSRKSPRASFSSAKSSFLDQSEIRYLE